MEKTFEIKKDVPIAPVLFVNPHDIKKAKEERRVIERKVELKPKEKRAYHRRSSKTVMGYTIKKGFNEGAVTGLRPYSWEPLFKALHVGEYIEFPKKDLVGFRSAASKYSRKLAPKRFVVTETKTGWQMGRIK